jgi:hypothetical protein
VVDLYPLQPVRERRLSLEAAETEESLDQNFLGKILGVVWIARDAAAVSHNAFLIAQSQLFKSAEIPFRGLQGPQ